MDESRLAVLAADLDMDDVRAQIEAQKQKQA